MTLSLKAVLHPAAQYEGVRPINIYLLRLVFALMFLYWERAPGRTSLPTAVLGNPMTPSLGASGRPLQCWRVWGSCTH